ncbi:MAG TPA: 1,4-dihydroxy-2-naphthoate octaprenyltransferase [candidate division Zixibacteria bacterium]|nr:1,4-dihydroxy-2-naphthoate octaprenyltransferase [candidate division Zixibacteria bacterium]
MNFFKKWMITIRLPFLTAAAVPVIFGIALAWQMTGRFDFLLGLITLLGVCFAQAGTNMANDYYDHKTTDDDINENPTPFSGGSRVIQEKIQTPGTVIRGALFFFGLAALCGLYLWLATRNRYEHAYTIPLLAIIGFLSGFLYTATPVKLGYRGLGELFIGLNFGALSVLGSYYVQTGQLGWTPIIASIPIAFLIAAVVYINQYPDYEADKAVDKKHWVVRLGKKNAIGGYLFLIYGSYIATAVAVILGYIPVLTLLVLLSLPLAINATRTLLAHYDKVEELIPANAATIKIHLTYGLLLAVGVVVDRIV